MYLNPIFTSPSVHKYDIEDFEHVDPYLGGDQALAELRAATSERDMRLVLDAVFNHCSDTHPWFNRWNTHPEPGAYGSVDAPYRDAFIFHDPADPDSYHCWQGSKVLPVLDFANPQVQDYFYAGRDAIVRRWLRPPYAVDGWRFDVVHMMGEGTGAANNAAHVRALRQAAKDENPDAYILGEHFFEATRWLQGDQEDGAMNYYGFAHPLRAFLAGQDVNYHPVRIDAADLDQWLTDARSRIPYANQLCQLNLLGSHDTTRFLTLLGEDRALMRSALLMQFTYPGVPCVYYGDEIGMTGQNDPYNRACFDWDQAHWDRDLHDFIRHLAGLRQDHTALRRGAYQTLIADGDLFGFARFDAHEQLLVLINRSPATVEAVALNLQRLPDSETARFTDLLIRHRAQHRSRAAATGPRRQSAAALASPLPGRRRLRRAATGTSAHAQVFLQPYRACALCRGRSGRFAADGAGSDAAGRGGARCQRRGGALVPDPGAWRRAVWGGCRAVAPAGSVPTPGRRRRGPGRSAHW